jgi:hypothetical protein
LSTADIAIAAITVISLAHLGADYRVRMRVADRMRLVSPTKEPTPPVAPAEAAAPPVSSISPRGEAA